MYYLNLSRYSIINSFGSSVKRTLFTSTSILKATTRKIMSDDESKIPDRDTCQKLTEDFAEITKTNEALAQTFLQDHGWDLHKSIGAFYEALSEETKNSQQTSINSSPDLYNPETEFSIKEFILKETITRCYASGGVVTFPALYAFNSNNEIHCLFTVERLFGKGKIVTTEPPKHLKLLSWNLDGLDEKNLKRRTKAVINIIVQLEPDIVFFQEVVPVTAEYLILKFPEYKCVKGGDENYFTMTMLRIMTIFYDKHSIVDYPETLMGRNLLVTEAHMGKLKFQLLNTHLESTAEHVETRKKQLKTAFDTCLRFRDDYTVIFGGDLNLRDAEAQVPSGFYDLWQYCGSHPEFRYTWDMTRNTNHLNFGKFKPKCRFDRIYFRFNKSKNAKPKHFALTGFEKVRGTQSFPSDHWGIVVMFNLDHSE